MLPHKNKHYLYTMYFFRQYSSWEIKTCINEFLMWLFYISALQLLSLRSANNFFKENHKKNVPNKSANTVFLFWKIDKKWSNFLLLDFYLLLFIKKKKKLFTKEKSPRFLFTGKYRPKQLLVVYRMRSTVVIVLMNTEFTIQFPFQLKRFIVNKFCLNLTDSFYNIFTYCG